jgi:hypothetical protein
MAFENATSATIRRITHAIPAGSASLPYAGASVYVLLGNRLCCAGHALLFNQGTTSNLPENALWRINTDIS